MIAVWLRVAVTDWVAVATLALPPLALAVWVRSIRRPLRRERQWPTWERGGHSPKNITSNPKAWNVPKGPAPGAK